MTRAAMTDEVDDATSRCERDGPEWRYGTCRYLMELALSVKTLATSACMKMP